MMRELAGRRLGSYRLIEQTAVGGMAVIFKAYDDSLDRYVAIKILPDYLSRDADFSTRFRNEARNVARLRHPNILPIFGYGEEEGLSYFVMDLVEGGTLKELMGSPLPVGRVEQLIGQIAGALNYAHEQGVVHRDVKPSNVLMLRPDWALLSDFGIARVLEQTANVTHTGSAFFGTPHYMAPEQARGEQVSARTDQYALGIVLYEMLTGETPYRADTPQAVVYQHIYSPPPRPKEKNPAVSEALQAVILHALAKDPEDRYPTMAAFSDAVHKAVDPGVLPAIEVGTKEPAESQPTPENFPPGGATPAFRPAATATRGTTGPFTERIEVAPAPEPEPAPTAPAVDQRGIPRWWMVAGGIAAIGIIVLIALFALRGGSSSAPTVRVALTAPVPVLNYIIQDTGGHTVTTGGSNGATVHVRLSAGKYLFNPVNVEDLILPVPFTVSSSKAQTIDLRPRYGRLSILPPSGLVSVPGLSVVRGRAATGVDSTAATQGFFVAPGRYTISFYPSDYPLTPAVRVQAGKTTTLDLSRIYGRLTVKPIAGAPASGLSVVRTGSSTPLTGINSDQERSGVFLPAGAYSLVFDNSDVYVDPVPAKVQVGSSTTLDLNTILAAVHVPSAPAYTLSYNWREGGMLRTITATPKRQTVYIVAGTYRMEVLLGGATRVVTVRASAGSTVSLPDR